MAIDFAPSTDRLLELIDGMASQAVPMLVDLVADRFITGTPKRISREAPVLILRAREHHDGPRRRRQRGGQRGGESTD